jgi:hypothetical protein
MIGSRVRGTPVVLAAALMTAGCAHQQPTEVLSTKSPVELRAMQTRAFDTTDQNKMLRTIVATLQDIGYTIGKVEPPAGTVSATKLGRLKVTATETAHGASQITVRVNAIVTMPGLKNTQVDDPVFYQQLIFEPLSKAIFLTALQVDDSTASDAGPPPADTKAADAKTTDPKPAVAGGAAVPAN